MFYTFSDVFYELIYFGTYLIKEGIMKKKILITSILAGTAMLVSCGGSTEKEPTVSLSNECVGNTCQITANVGDDVFNLKRV